MISLPQRQQIVQWVDEASVAGARRHKACELLGITARALQRWRQSGELGSAGRTDRAYEPQNKLSDAEREQILAVANSAEFADLPPSQIVPRLADQGRYLASESSFYRILRAQGQQHHRGRARQPARA